MKYFFIICSFFISSQISYQELFDYDNDFAIKDFPLYKNGDCVQHNSDPKIQYAISGKDGDYYQLTVWENNLPRSMIIGFPIHSSDIVIGKMFHKIECNPDVKAFSYEIFDDFYDPYRESTPLFIGYM